MFIGLVDVKFSTKDKIQSVILAQKGVMAIGILIILIILIIKPIFVIVG